MKTSIRVFVAVAFAATAAAMIQKPRLASAQLFAAPAEIIDNLRGSNQSTAPQITNAVAVQTPNAASAFIQKVFIQKVGSDPIEPLRSCKRRTQLPRSSKRHRPMAVSNATPNGAGRMAVDICTPY